MLVVPLTGMIHAASAEGAIAGLAEAERRQVALVVVEIDTPGGYMTSMEEIQNAVLASKVPVAAFVAPSGASAASAGFFVLMTADVAAMAPGTSTGSAHPVMVGGGGDEESGSKGPSVMEKKLEHHAAARMRSVVERRGRNVTEAEQAVRESVSFTDQEALAKHLIELVAPDVQALVRDLDGRTVRRFDGTETVLALRGASIERLEPTLRQRVLAAIAIPQIAYLLLLVGMLGIYVEFTHPGLVAPGVVGGISLLLALYATTVLSVNLAGVLLIAAAGVLFALEVKFTSYGILGAGGVTALVLGSLMLFKGPLPGLELTLVHVLPVSLSAAFVILALASVVVRSRRIGHVTGREGLVGLSGTALTEVGSGTGRVFVHGESWSARAARPILTGERVRVIAVADLVLEVESEGGAPRPAV